MNTIKMKILTSRDMENIRDIVEENNWSPSTLYSEINNYILNNCPQIGIIKSKNTIYDFISGKRQLYETNERRVKAWLEWYNSCEYIGEQIINKDEYIASIID